MFRHGLTTVTIALLMLQACSFSFLAPVACWSADGADTESLFNAKYQAWVDARNDPSRKNPRLNYRPILPEQLDLQNMGPRVLPFMFKKLEDDQVEQKWDDDFLTDNLSIVYLTTLKSFPKEEWPEGEVSDMQTRRTLYIKWWKEGRKETRQKFDALHRRWKELLGGGKTKDAKSVLDDIRYMGTEVLPLVMDQVRKGDSELVPFINKLMRKKVLSDTATRDSALQWWEKNKEALKFPPIPPDPPVGPEK